MSDPGPLPKEQESDLAKPTKKEEIVGATNESHKRPREENEAEDTIKDDKEVEGTSKDDKDIPKSDTNEIDSTKAKANKKAKLDKNDEHTTEVTNLKESDPSDIITSEQDPNKSTSVNEKPKFVFGSGTSFGAGFGAFKKVGTDKNESLNKEEKKSPKPFAFGSGLSFGSGFGILKKQNEPNKEKEDDDKETENENKQAASQTEAKNKDETLDFTKEETDKEKETTSSLIQETPVKLQKQDIRSGEESEETIFQVNAKLYQLSDLKNGWKERGVGIVRVNKNVNTEKSRLIMRSRGILKVILNLPLIKGIKIHRGFPGSLQSEKFIRIISVDGNKSPIQYALKTGKEETVSELYDSIVKLVPQ